LTGDGTYRPKLFDGVEPGEDEEAVRLLLSLVERRDPTAPEHRLLETRLIVRGSTGPAPLERQHDRESLA
jgi:hypothetical protein